MKKILLVLAVFVLLSFLGYFAASRVWGFPFLSFGGEDQKGGGKSATVSLGQFITNLVDEGRFIRVTIELEVDEKKLPDVNSRLGEIKTDVYALLRSRTYAQLTGETGLRDLQKDIADQITQKCPGALRNVFFSEFIVQ